MKQIYTHILTAILSFFGFVGAAQAQTVGIKTNLLYWGTTTPNVTLDVRFSDHWTGSVTGAYNPWQFPSYTHATSGETVHPKLKHWLVMPELKWWPCKVWDRHAIGVHGVYAEYNVGGLPFVGPLKDYRYQGWLAGGGLSWTYHWVIGKRWGMEFSLGAGYVYTRYAKYECSECGEKLGDYNRHYVGPTKAALSFIYFIN